ncbi:YesL family protein [Bifidobacterium crudilactis]|jgi:uncharacterized membrane protein YesL|uniref:DUF624 domain-containing protein n=1 Tax=Bifidobacterium crudilactis TaxID=327277 RepID=A0A971CZG6_9BIFI|nr:YesL family protein [Bifidobacterium crudilactis]MCI1868572.1 DUF624 domain-containing protein [Bifidobacterium crudilactis]MDN5973089.1 DUF624 domain-containing protein [Bifidobacterium crudilactis]MDN6001188.1 DUF624 domain-containing protein [Bifidobacterium crudilactis]MDN6210071.1 DUF624 domain-containing protein [Bifidobacterium crudilactis]MDN6233638.1 DUF624 domain-containing protein [Bifidobacterium crudilactis]
MKEFFSIDGKVYAVLNVMLELLELNLLFMLGCLPVLTIGTSVASLYEVVFQIRAEGTVRVFSRFRRAYRENLRRGTALWAIVAGAFGAMLLLYWLMSNATQGNIVVLIPVCVLIAVMMLAAMLIFPIAGRYDMTVPAILGAALSLSLQHVLFTALAFMLMLVIIVVIPLFAPRLWFLWIFFAFSVTAYLQSWLFMRVFDMQAKAQ